MLLDRAHTSTKLRQVEIGAVVKGA